MPSHIFVGSVILSMENVKIELSASSANIPYQSIHTRDSWSMSTLLVHRLSRQYHNPSPYRRISLWIYICPLIYIWSRVAGNFDGDHKLALFHQHRPNSHFCLFMTYSNQKCIFIQYTNQCDELNVKFDSPSHNCSICKHLPRLQRYPGQCGSGTEYSQDGQSIRYIFQEY